MQMQPDSLIQSGACSLVDHTCSTCSLSDRENVYRKELSPSSDSSSSSSSNRENSGEEEQEEEEGTASRTDSDSLEALIPPKRVVAAAAPAPSTKYTYTSLLAQGQLYFR